MATIKAISTKATVKTAVEYIEDYRKARGIVKITNTGDFRHWLEGQVGAYLPNERPLFMSTGKGGGQGYRTLHLVNNVHGNSGHPCVFYTEAKGAREQLKKEGHIHLDDWLASL